MHTVEVCDSGPFAIYRLGLTDRVLTGQTPAAGRPPIRRSPIERSPIGAASGLIRHVSSCRPSGS